MSAALALATESAAAWAGPALARLVDASLAGGLAVALVYLVLRLAPRLPPALRCTLWWLACLKLVLALVWVRPLTLPLPLPATLATRLPAAAPAADRPAEVVDTAPNAASGLAGAVHGRSTRPLPSAPAVPAWRFAGSLAGLGLFGLWAAGLAAGLLGTARQLAAVRRIRRGARPADSPALVARFHELARRAGLSRAPALLVAERVASPISLGLLAPAVVLPADLTSLSAEQLDMALCHELLHVRRADLWLAWVPAAAARLFFFHPLARLAAREYALAREAACDAEVLARLAAPPAVYARLLLGFGVAGGAVGRSTGAVALGAAPSPGTLKRRLLMLDSVTRRPRAPWLWLAGLAALAALVPFRIAAQPAPAASTEHHVHRTGTGDSYVLLSKGGNVTMSGSSADVARVRGLAGADGELLWFRRGGREYVIHDPALLAQAAELFAPQAALGKQQGELGERQGKLGEKQGQLGARQGELGAKQGALAVRESGAAEGDRERLEHEQDELGRQQDELGRQQEELGRQQEELGRQQEELGSRQEKLAHEAEARLKTLFDDALAHGTAQEVR